MRVSGAYARKFEGNGCGPVGEPRGVSSWTASCSARTRNAPTTVPSYPVVLHAAVATASVGLGLAVAAGASDGDEQASRIAATELYVTARRAMPIDPLTVSGLTHAAAVIA